MSNLLEQYLKSELNWKQILSEARFTIEKMDRATELMAHQLEKRLNIKLIRQASEKFRKKRKQDLYTLKYEIEDDVSKLIHKIISFLWSKRGEGYLMRIEIFSWSNKYHKYRNPIVIDVMNIGITRVIDMIYDELKKIIITGHDTKNKKTEYENLLKAFRDMGGKETHYAYILGDKKELIISFFDTATPPYEYKITLLRKIMGLSYNSKYTNERRWGDPDFILDMGLSDEDIERLKKEYPEIEDPWKDESEKMSDLEPYLKKPEPEYAYSYNKKYTQAEQFLNSDLTWKQFLEKHLNIIDKTIIKYLGDYYV